LAGAIAVACGSDDTTTSGAGGADSGAGDATNASDANGAADASGGADAAGSADAGDGGSSATFNDIADAGGWEAFDVTTLDPRFANGASFQGAAFDGRYLYLVPYDRNYIDAGETFSGIVVRFDTQMPFTSAGSWSLFDVATVDPNAASFLSAAFDGRYVEFSAGAGSVRLAARFDTKGTFTDKAAWTVAQRPLSQQGSAFDGRFMFHPTVFAPRVDRYDTQGAFDAGDTFDVSSINGDAGGFQGAFFDGRYAYFVPSRLAGIANGVVPRLDTQGSFLDAGSWQIFDVGTKDTAAKGFGSGVFDGRYAYFAPYSNQSGPDGVVARYDTAAPFDAPGSWTTFDLVAQVSPSLGGFFGAVFDGRYVYFAPGYNDAVGRFDTLASFTDKAAWSSFKTTTLNANASQFRGAAFDGRYAYFIPGVHGVIVRFDAKSPPSVPASYHGSFL
jgi:hypothetical protein